MTTSRTSLESGSISQGLRERLEKEIAADPSYGLVKMRHAGSVAKGTALAGVNDLDTAVYVKAAEVPSGGDAQLVPWLAERLYEANTNMARDQFVEELHCVRVNFKGSGLDVDVVPVLYEGEPEDRGYLVRKHTGDRVLTSITLHLKFIRDRKTKYGPEFAELIRITTWWKRVVARNDEDFKFKSFLIELLWAHLADGGLDLVRRLRAMDAYRNVPVLTFSAREYTPEQLSGVVLASTHSFVKSRDREYDVVLRLRAVLTVRRPRQILKVA